MSITKISDKIAVSGWALIKEVGYGASILSGWMRSRPAVLSWINRTSGVVIVALGIRLALERRG